MTNRPAAALRDSLGTLGLPELLERDELLDALTSLGEAQAVLDAAKVRVAGELVARGALVGPQNPVVRAGHASPATLIAERWRISAASARDFCRAGEATARQTSLVGEVLPPRFPALAQVMRSVLVAEQPSSARVTVDQAAVIVRELAKAASGCSVADFEAGERLLVEHAPDLTIRELGMLAAHVRDRLDQDGIEPREARQRHRRSMTVTTTADGMVHIDWYLDPESAGYVVTAIDAVVGQHVRRPRFTSSVPEAANGSTDGASDLLDDNRSLP